MSYLQDRKRNIRNKKIFFSFFVVLVFVVLVASGPDGFLGRAFRSVGVPLWKTQNKISENISDNTYLVRTKKSVFSENEILKTRNDELVLSMMDYDLLKKENEELRSLLGRVNQKGSVVLGTIVAKPNKSLYDTILIDIGSDHGINIGDVVWSGMEFPIGKITTVNPDNSIATLFSSAGWVTSAQIDGTNTSVDLVGRGGNNFEINVPHDLMVPNGSFVIAPQMNSKIVAIVVDVISDPHEPMNKIILKSPINVQDLKWVQVQK